MHPQLNEQSPLAKFRRATQAQAQAEAVLRTNYNNRLELRAGKHGQLELVDDASNERHVVQLDEESGRWLAEQLVRVLGLDA